MDFDLYIEPLSWVYLISLAISLCLAVHALTNQRHPTARAFGYLMACISLLTTTYIIKLCSVYIEAKLFWAAINLGVITLCSTLWLRLALMVTNHNKIANAPAFMMFAIISSIAVFLFVLTNEEHQLFWTNIEHLQGQADYRATFGIAYKAFHFVIVGLLSISVVLFLRNYKLNNQRVRKQVIWLTIGTLIPIVGRVLKYSFDWYMPHNLDEVILLVTLSCLCLAFALIRYNTFNFSPINRAKIIETLPLGIIIVNSEYHIMEVNSLASSVLKKNNRDIIGAPLNHFLPRIVDKQYFEVPVHDLEHTSWYRIQKDKIESSNSKLLGYTITLSNITEQKETEQQLQAIARHDFLTGLFNRRAVEEIAEKDFEYCSRNQLDYSIALIDLDLFKRINDSLGHDIGDQVLKLFSKLLQSVLNDSDVVGRYGGEEFILAVNEKPEHLVRVLELLRSILDSRIHYELGLSEPIRFTAGIADIQSANKKSLAKLISAADEALYEGKHSGRNQTCLFKQINNSLLD